MLFFARVARGQTAVSGAVRTVRAQQLDRALIQQLQERCDQQALQLQSLQAQLKKASLCLDVFSITTQHFCHKVRRKLLFLWDARWCSEKVQIPAGFLCGVCVSDFLPQSNSDCVAVQQTWTDLDSKRDSWMDYCSFWILWETVLLIYSRDVGDLHVWTSLLDKHIDSGNQQQ